MVFDVIAITTFRIGTGHLEYVLENLPPPGRNRVIIAHNLPESIGLGQIPDMATVVLFDFRLPSNLI